MHDCHRTKTTLVDLVFGEMDAGEQQHALAEVRNCPTCSAEYHSMLATLRIFDQAADAAMPDESYWAGYEARLRTKLAEPVAPTWQERLAGWFAPLLSKPAIPATVAGLILLAAISVVWFSKQKTDDSQVLVGSTSPTPQPSPTMRPPQTEVSAGEIQPKLQTTVAGNVRQPRRPRPAPQPKEVPQDDFVAANPPQQSVSSDVLPVVLAAADPAAHLENAQMLLRAFRNAREGRNADSANLAYEKRQARKLVYDNILLRREAEAKGNMPVEEALNSLEPLLMDIANLPANPSRSDVRTIQERIQKQEIIATLQIVGTGAANGAERYGTSVPLNQE